MDKDTLKTTIAARHPGRTDALSIADTELLIDNVATQDDLTTSEADIVTVTADVASARAGEPVVEAVTAAAAPGTTIAVTTGHATVTSGNADHVIVLNNSSIVGKELTGFVGANGCEMRTGVAGVKINDVDCETQEAALPASTAFWVKRVSATAWILRCWDLLGAEITPIIPD